MEKEYTNLNRNGYGRSHLLVIAVPARNNSSHAEGHEEDESVDRADGMCNFAGSGLQFLSDHSLCPARFGPAHLQLEAQLLFFDSHSASISKATFS